MRVAHHAVGTEPSKLATRCATIDLHLTVMAVRRLPFIANLSEVDRAMLHRGLRAWATS